MEVSNLVVDETGRYLSRMTVPGSESEIVVKVKSHPGPWRVADNTDPNECEET